MTPNSDFAERLERIRAKRGQAQILIGTDQQIVLPRKAVPQVSRRAEIARNALQPLSLIGALGLGMIAVAIGSYARFHLTSGAELADSDLEMLAGLGLGLAISFILAQAFRLTSAQHRAMQAAGVFVMVGLFHNLAHWLPGPMALAFSPAHVQRLAAATPPNSFRFRGAYVPLFDTAAPPAAEAPALAALPATEAAPQAAAADCTAEDQAAAPHRPPVRKGGKPAQTSGAKFLTPESATPCAASE